MYVCVCIYVCMYAYMFVCGIIVDVASSSNMTSPNSSLNCSSGSLAKSLGSGKRFRSAVKLIINEKRATSHYKAKYTYNGADLVAHG